MPFFHVEFEFLYVTKVKNILLQRVFQITLQLFQLLVHSWKALCHFCIRSDIIGDNNCILLCKCDRNETMIVLFPLVSFFFSLVVGIDEVLL